jgi:hypothetical protein
VAEGIVTPEGKPVNVDPASAEDIEKQFARAMSEPGDEKSPPRRAERHQEKTEDSEKPRVRRSPGRPPKAATEPPKTKSPGLSREVRQQGIQGIAQLAAGGCLLAERGTGNRAFRADAITLASSAEEIGSAVADVCDQDERFARVVDKICAAGPYSALITVMFSVGSQLARNHGAQVPGTNDPGELIKMAEAQPAAA